MTVEEYLMESCKTISPVYVVFENKSQFETPIFIGSSEKKAIREADEAFVEGIRKNDDYRVEVKRYLIDDMLMYDIEFETEMDIINTIINLNSECVYKRKSY